jgi:hypothetical protein
MFNLKKKEKKHNTRGDRTADDRGPTRAQEKIAKRLMGKSTGRHIFGFPCSPDIHAKVKMRAGELQVDMYALSEHCMQLGIDTVDDAIEDSEERDLLRRHLIEQHIDQRTIEKLSWYDEELAEQMQKERLAQFEVDRVVRRLVVDFARRGMNPKYMPYYLDYGYRCFFAVIRGSPIPKPPERMPGRESRRPKNQSSDEKGNEYDDDSSKPSG